MRRFEHAAAARELAEALLVRLRLDDGREGWGETLPRKYVTGETLDSARAAIERTLWPAATALDVADPGAPAALPFRDGDGRCIHAARCAVELACRDATAPPPPVGRIGPRVSGVLGSADPGRTARRLRLMRWFGLRDFKLKLGFGEEIDGENLRLVHARIGRALAAGKMSLRVDVNGGWPAETAAERVAALSGFGVCAVEQPVFCPAAELAALADRCALPLLADESLLGPADAEALLARPDRVWWNVRISKCGGLDAAADLLDRAREAGVTVSCGCMVGESGILSAAQRRLLAGRDGVRFVEGNYGRFLLADDLTAPSPRFGFGGRLRVLRGGGLGVRVLRHRVETHAEKLASLRP